MGYLLSIGVYMGIYYRNTWDSRKFPFLSRKSQHVTNS